MFITADMLIIHLIGDYILQSDKMADNKSQSSKWALIHVLIYTMPFLLLTTSFYALSFIMFTHFIIDRYKLVRYVIFSWNKLWDYSILWQDCKTTGYSKNKPIWLSTWLFIIIDNTIHIILNAYAINFL